MPPLIRFLIYYTLAVIAVIFLVSFSLSVDQAIGLRLPDAMRFMGILLFVVGGALGGWCVLLFVTIGQGTPAPFDPPQKFVVRGPYRYIRNPMYIGMLGIFSGIAFFFVSPTFLFLTLAWLAFVNFLMIPWEEWNLEGRFGEAYRQYKASVPRWIPKF